MRKFGLSLFVAALVVVLPSQATAQTKCDDGSYVIELDHATGRIAYRFVNPDGTDGAACIARGMIESGTTVQVRVLNMNPFLYALTVDGKTETAAIQVPDIFTKNLSGQPAAPAPAPAVPAAAPGVAAFAAAAAGAANATFEQTAVRFEQAMVETYDVVRVETLLADAVHGSDGQSRKKLRKNAAAVVAAALPGGGSSPAAILAAGSTALGKVASEYNALQRDYAATGKAEKEARRFALLQKQYEAFLKDRTKITGGLANAARLLTSVRAASFDYASVPFQAKGDSLTVSVEIKRNAALDKKYATTRTFKKDDFVVLEVTGGVRVDFSAGFFFTSLRDEAYTTEDDPAGAPVAGAEPAKLIKRSASQESTFTAATGSMLHIYERGTKSWRPALSLGLGLNNSGDVTYFGGASLLLGKTARGVISAGVAGGKVKRLGGGFDLGDPLPAGTKEVPTDSPFRLGWFVGFTYNLSPAPQPKKK